MAEELFAGKWNLTEVDNFEELIKALGIGWVKRKAMSAMSYGVGRMSMEIKVEGGAVIVESQNGTNEIRFGEEANFDTPDGRTITLMHTLEEGVWTATGPEMTIIREIEDNGGMKMQMIVDSVVGTRWFTKEG